MEVQYVEETEVGNDETAGAATGSQDPARSDDMDLGPTPQPPVSVLARVNSRDSNPLYVKLEMHQQLSSPRRCSFYVSPGQWSCHSRFHCGVVWDCRGASV